MARINSVIDDDLLQRLRHVLVDEKISLSEWIRRMAETYIEAKEPKGKRRKGKEAWRWA
jgi:metal-responsive CopG/Arc/MetJ family transcriptional regulator